ncbi:MAG: class I SAM-dependent methyltransferase [Acidobacteriota bacterium]|nr:class I SAM-dependent methyltransferase [Acidobacteriota bacterium]
MNKVRFWRYRHRFGAMDRRDTFSVIYRDRIFGDAPGEQFYSGDGSTGRFADSYCELIADIVREKEIRSIVDLGCGDFRIGARLAPLVSEYRGIDIVPDLIEHNRREYGSDRISFDCLDIVEDQLPPGDLCLVRQVLQHLSNQEISAVLRKTRAYKRILITENVTAGIVKFPNVDLVHGPKTRLVEDSGVFVTKPPFSQVAVRTWEFPYDEKSILLAVLLRP